MNERIKELILAAGFDHRVIETPDGQLLHQPVFNAERFAELLLKNVYYKYRKYKQMQQVHMRTRKLSSLRFVVPV